MELPAGSPMGVGKSKAKVWPKNSIQSALLDEVTKMLKSLLVSERLNQGEHDQDKDKNDRHSYKNW